MKFHCYSGIELNLKIQLPLSIVTEDHDFSMNLTMTGTIVFVETHTPSNHRLSTCKHIELTSSNSWDPNNVCFLHSKISLEEMMADECYISSTHRTFDAWRSQGDHDINNVNDRTIFDLDAIKDKFASSLTKPEDMNSGNTDIPLTSTFQSSDQHSDISTQSLSEQWGTSISTASKTLKQTMQRFLHNTILPLGQRYQQDRLFTHRTLNGEWATDTLDGHCKSLDGNGYAQVFTNKTYFSRIYPMDSKRKADDALQTFCKEFGVPKKLTFDGLKEQCKPGTWFMKQIHTHDITYHISEADLHNQNPAEGVIGKIRQKWYRLMVWQRVPKQLWNYGGMRYISDISSLTHTTAGSLGGVIPLQQVTGETPDISEYWDFGFYDAIWYKDNAGASLFEPGCWLDISENTGCLMTYYALIQHDTVISRSTVQRMTSSELSTTNVTKMFMDFDNNIAIKLKHKISGFQGDKPNSEDWADLLSQNPDYNDEFNKIWAGSIILTPLDHLTKFY
jgi:hypothetical protein